MIAAMPPAERFPHGTKARYAARCRCDECRAAQRRWEAERREKVRRAAAECEPNPGPVRTRMVERGGVRFRIATCPGTDGTPCVTGGTWLKPPWPHPVCRTCVDHARVHNPLVPTVPVRRHLLRLQRQGVGHKSVAAACDVGKTVLSEIIWGAKSQIRRRAAERILAVTVDAAADGGRIPAAATWRLVAELLDAGMTKGEIGRAIGQKTKTLQLGKRVCEARTALLIRRLHARVTAEARERFPRDPIDPRFVRADVVAAVVGRLVAAGLSKREIGRRIGFQMKTPRSTPGTLRKLRALLRQLEVNARVAALRKQDETRSPHAEPVCVECGFSHAAWARQARLARLLPAEAEALYEALPCYYPRGKSGAGERALYRDLRAIGAVNVGGTWTRRDGREEVVA